MEGKAVVFVGGTSGIGLAAATELGRRGARVLLVGRSAARGAAAAREVRGGEFLAGDVSRVAGIAKLAVDVRTWAGDGLHGLVHSAMAPSWTRTETPDGFELAFGVQYLARHALNRLLVDVLARSGDGRVVHVAGAVPRGTVPDLDDLQFVRRRWRLFGSLMSSQVLGYLHVQEAARRYPEVLFTLACVGPTRTGPDQLVGAPWWAKVAYALVATTPEKSARNVVRLLTGDRAEVQVAQGANLRDPKRFVPTRLSADPELARRAWDIADELLRSRGLAALVS